MKKILPILLLLVVALIIWFCLNKQNPQKPLTSEPSNTVVEPPQSQPETNFIKVASNTTPVEVVQQPANIVESTEAMNVLTATNIEQWKAAIKELHKSPGLTESWGMEQTNLTTGIPITLEKNGQIVSYKAQFINIDMFNADQIRKVEIHSPVMNIDETRKLGLQLCTMLGRDPSDFLAWCDKVGNHWVDSTLFSSGGSPVPNSGKFAGFGILHTYNNDSPWYIDFFITSP